MDAPIDRCPTDPEETADALLVGDFTPAALSFAEHIKACPACARVVCENTKFIEAIRAAASLKRSESG